MRRITTISAAAVIMAVVLALGAASPASAMSADGVSLPAQDAPDPNASDKVVRMARAGWDTGWFQAEIYKQLLHRLGYQVIGPMTMDNDEFYSAVDDGTVDMWANGWFPLHDRFIAESDSVETVGAQVSGGALQGYFVDRATAEAHDIDNLGDLADPAIAALFDADGNGLADLVGCDEGWTCASIIEAQIEAFGLSDRVEQVQGAYSPLMKEVVARYKAGSPVLYYTWTPNWTVGLLKPGTDVVWLQTPPTSTVESEARQVAEAAQALTDATVQVEGCAQRQCRTGWVPSDIRVVANTDFLEANPAVRTLLEQVVIPLEDISAQNARMVNGQGAAEGDPEDIVAHAKDWIVDHQSLVAGWIDTADPGAVAYSPDGDAVGGGGVLRVAARVLPPFVTYADGKFGGFEVDLARMLGNRMGMTTEIYGIDTVAKQIDDLNRAAADVALGGVTITKSRETQVDFSLPVLDTGLRIMVPVEDRSGLRRLIGGFLTAIADPGLLVLLAGVAVAVLLAAHLIWWMERRHNSDFAKPYPKGIWDSFYWSVVTMSTVGYGDKVPKANVGRAFSLLWIIFGTLVFATLTASIASSLAVDRLRQEISGPSDLPGRIVATVTESSGQAYLSSVGIGPVFVNEIEAAYELLEDGDVDAVVFDAPVLDYWASHNSGGKFTTVGAEFDKVSYGIAVSDQNAELREQINRVLLDAIESGEYDLLRDRWFGAS